MCRALATICDTGPGAAPAALTPVDGGSQYGYIRRVEVPVPHEDKKVRHAPPEV